MGRVANVAVDQTPELSDLLFGTNYVGGLPVNYRIGSVLELLNKNNKIQFEFSDGVNTDITYNTEGKFFTDTNSLNPLDFTKLILNKQNLKPLDLTPLFNKLAGTQNVYMTVESQSDSNSFFEFKVSSIENHDAYFTFNVAVSNNYYLGLLVNNKGYNIRFDVAKTGLRDIGGEIIY